MRSLLSIMLLLSLVLPVAAQDRPKPCGALPKSWDGLAYAIEGDTLTGVGLKPPIRLWGINAPRLRVAEAETIPGMRVRAALEDLLEAGEHRVSCKVAHWDDRCRLVAQCTITSEMPRGTPPAAHDVALRLLEDGLAYGYELGAALPWDSEASARYAHYEAISRQARKGLWPFWLGESDDQTPPPTTK
ncbi:thermonuclease family protein [Reyranella sp.]|jgi:endonuclease YncB( thermonuclease family)|uniref:thermonuclease family protein n=1 Tax=Reyranella sp. TaxID=1929291 RepID=UPI002F941DF6